MNLGWGPKALREIICAVLKKRPDTNNWSDPNVESEVEELIFGCKWFKVYDIIEEIHADIEEHDRKKARRFISEINDFFVEEGIGWQLNEGEIVTRGDDGFERTVRTAQTELSDEGRMTAAERVGKAVKYLSARPKPDTSGAISHATGAMECVLNDITGEELTLGDFLKRHPSLFPGSMKKALEGLWGFSSSEGARHGREGVEPSRDDAQFLVAIAAAVTTYLNRKHKRR
jgi:hypothetical protein